MQYRRLGQSALKLSALSYGSWITFGTTLDDRAARDCLACAYDHGINFFDSAEVYLGGEAERMLGRAIKALGWPRDGYCVSSKALYGAADNHAPGGGPRPTQQGLSRKHLVEACEQALRRFGLDYLDLYLCHRPDPDMSIPEIAWTMHAGATGQDPVLGHFGMAGGRHRDAVRLCRAPRPGAAAAGAAAVQPVPSRARRARVPSAGRAARAGADDLVAAGLGRAGRPV